jgi:hypothetical protein
MAYYAVEYVLIRNNRHLEVRPGTASTRRPEEGPLLRQGDTGGLAVFRSDHEAEVGTWWSPTRTSRRTRSLRSG